MSNKPFQNTLKEIHQSQDKIAPLIEGLEGEIPQQSMKDYFVKLQILLNQDDENKSRNHENISGEKKEIELQNLFDPLPDGRVANKLLILGGAGVGKSTLMQYIGYRWGSEQLWNDKFDFVYRVRLKTLLNNQWTKYYSIEEQREDLLKCLAHHNLMSDKLKLSEMEWPVEKDRVLLLLDGYDEIAGLKNISYERLEKTIFDHKYLIFTSRPNAVGKSMKSNFDKVLENTGLDNSGIENYFKLYFQGDQEDQNKDKETELRKFIEGNQTILQICKVPVNIAMLCYIWSTSKSSEKLKQISNITALYKKMVDHLGERYFAKEWNENETGMTLEDALYNGKFILDEFKVLADVAYKGMTGGGINVAEEDRVENLIIKGAQQNKDGEIDREDEDGISILSSINYLSSHKEIDDDQKRKVTVGKVCKYGLLKVEGIVPLTKGKMSDTNAQGLSYSFIHLTFQEYLAAFYLKEQLMSNSVPENQKRDICKFIGDHRNEPRYLMMLKFLTGLLTADQSKGAEDTVKIFWDAVVCNIDGLIELGVENKVGLIMHLLEQAKIKGMIDLRVPQKNQMTLFIDAVVLHDLFSWTAQLKESDYMSETIKEAIMKAFLDKDLQWANKKLTQIYEETSGSLQGAIKQLIENSKKNELNSIKSGQSDQKDEKQQKQKDIIVEFAMRMMKDLTSKFTSSEQRSIIDELKEIVSTERTQHSWIFLSQAYQLISKLVKEVSLTEEESLKLIDIFMLSFDDKSLLESASDAMTTILLQIPRKEEIAAQVLKNLPPAPVHELGVIHSRTILPPYIFVKIAKALGSKAFIIQQLSSGLFSSLELYFFTKFAGELVSVYQDKDIVIKVLEVCFDIVSKGRTYFDPQVISKIINDETIAAVVNKLVSSFSHENEEVCAYAVKSYSQLIKASKDKTTASKHLKSISDFIASTKNDKDCLLRGGGVEALWQTVEIIGDRELAKKEAEKLLDFISDLCIAPLAPNSDSRNIFDIRAFIYTTQLVEMSQDKSVRAKAIKCIFDHASLFVKALPKIDMQNQLNKQLYVMIQQDKKVIEDLLDRMSHPTDEEDILFTTNLLMGTLDSLEDQSMCDKVLESLIKMCNDNLKMKQYIFERTPLFVHKIRSKVLIDRITSLLVESYLDSTAESAMMAILQDGKSRDNKSSITELVEKLVRMFAENIDDDSFKIINKLIFYWSKLIGGEEIAIRIVEELVTILPTKEWKVKDKLIKLINLAMGSIRNRDIVAKISKEDLLHAIRDSTIGTKNIVCAINDEGFLVEIIEAIIEDIKTENSCSYDQLANILAIFKVARREEFAEKTSEMLVKLFCVEGSPFLQETKTFAVIVDCAFDNYNKLANKLTVEMTEKLIALEKITLSDISSTLLMIVGNQQIITKLLEKVFQALEGKENVYTFENQFRIIVTEFLGSSEGVLKCLQISNPGIRKPLEDSLRGSFESFWRKFETINQLLKDPQKITIDLINEKICYGPMNLEIQDQIKSTLQKLQDEKYSNVSLEKLQNILISHLEYIDSPEKKQKVIEVVLGIISNEETGKELINSARKMLDFQLKYLDDQALDSINKNFFRLVAQSRESKPFIRKVYHKLLEDSEITNLEKELMIKFINQGLTTSINRNKEIIFEGKRYKMKGKRILQILDEIGKAVIDEERDILAAQYKEHKPLFLKSMDSGMKRASADIEVMYSIVEKLQILTPDEWLLSELEDENKKKIQLLEKRNAIGDHMVYWLNQPTAGEHKMMMMNNEDCKKILEEIFGKQVIGKKFQGRSTSISIVEGDQLINNEIQDLEKLFKDKESSSKEYFQQELLNLGNTERIDQINKELNTKLTDYEKVLDTKLSTKISSEDQSKIKDYFRAFVETFASIYTAAQVIDSGQVQLDAGSTETKVLSTLASFVPYAGDTLSGAINSIGEFLKSKEMIQNARTMKKLASDGTNLNQLVSETAMKIVLDKTKQNHILSISDEEINKISGNTLEKIKKFISNFNEKIDEYLYTKKFNSPAAKLGNIDANELIEYWVKGKVKSTDKALIQARFVEIGTKGTKETNEIASPSKSEKEVDRAKTACCSLFAVSEVRYEKPLLNYPNLLHRFYSSYGNKATNNLINLCNRMENERIMEMCKREDAFENLVSLLDTMLTPHKDLKRYK